jgi:hypothetical protein
MEELHGITKIIKVEDFSLILEFDKKEIRKVDLSEKFKAKSQSPGSKYGELLDKEKFKHVHLNSEWETIYWDNGLDLDPIVLYDMSIPITND